uniref:RING-type E3 ubiquitin transferase n=2 Tax=Cajanus cajan TaxID=3821 RepID=A0A151S8A6_CAJCA|nr:RING-H2 finger protein ATL3L [Cajanus cajan]
MDPDIESKYAHNGKVMVGTAILLFILILIVIIFHTYVRFCRRRRRLLLSHSLPTSALASGEPRLDPAVLKALPTFTFSAAHRPLEDCAVCLSEFSDGDEGRVLPNCSHAFHAHCIDAWFASHSTCPLCRTTVQPEASGETAEAGEGCSSSVACPRKALELGIIVEVAEVERGSDPVTGDQGLRWTLKRLS